MIYLTQFMLYLFAFTTGYFILDNYRLKYEVEKLTRITDAQRSEMIKRAWDKARMKHICDKVMKDYWEKYRDEY